MNDLAQRISRLRPELDPLRDFLVRNDHDGRGAYLAEWNEKRLGPIPTEAELLAVDMMQPTAGERDRQTLKALRAKAEESDIDAADVKQIVKLLLKRE